MNREHYIKWSCVGIKRMEVFHKTMKLQNTLPWTIMKDRRTLGLKTFRQRNGGEAPEHLAYLLAQMYPIIVEASETQRSTYQCIYQKNEQCVISWYLTLLPKLFSADAWTVSLINFYSDLGYQYFHCYLTLVSQGHQEAKTWFPASFPKSCVTMESSSTIDSITFPVVAKLIDLNLFICYTAKINV